MTINCLQLCNNVKKTFSGCFDPGDGGGCKRQNQGPSGIANRTGSQHFMCIPWDVQSPASHRSSGFSSVERSPPHSTQAPSCNILVLICSGVEVLLPGPLHSSQYNLIFQSIQFNSSISTCEYVITQCTIRKYLVDIFKILVVTHHIHHI
jgi:hypothetical protein